MVTFFMDVKSVGRTLDVFELIAGEQRPLTLTEVAAALEVPVSNCFNLVRALKGRGIPVRHRVAPANRSHSQDVRRRLSNRRERAQSPASIILMTVLVVLPPLRAAGFDLIWFGVIMTIVMEMGLIHPPVGLNIFVIKSIAPDITLKQIMWGTLPFVGIMAATVLLLCVFPGPVTGLPNLIMK
jgi:Tripartite ATP-independent periplasmic transporter, DctM component/IclR helix-turn-helix domain